ncbi:MAG: GMC oxidoreductase, partial [Pseudomonadota bacterium]
LAGEEGRHWQAMLYRLQCSGDAKPIILFDENRATGVRYRCGGQQINLCANREVLLCGGVFNSPQLLQLSGIGDGDRLRELGVAVTRHLPGVGENLRDHCYAPVSARVQDVRSLNERSRGWRLGLEVLDYLLTRNGLLSMQPSMAYVSWKSDPALAWNDLQISFGPASYDATKDMALNTYPGVTCAPWQHRPHSKGFVRINSADVHRAPTIQANYLDDERDRHALLAAMRLSRQILQSPSFAPYFAGEDQPGSEVNSDDEWLDFIRQTCGTTYHPMGSCRMAPESDPTAVVDDQLCVHGIERLRVVDASIMPSMTSGNTNAATLMIAEKAADMILGNSPLPPVDLG